MRGRDSRALYSHRLTAVRMSWISGAPAPCNWVYGGKTRYRQKDSPCAVVEWSDARCTIDFAEAQWAVTPGQSVVLYESRVCLGGGIIEEAVREPAGAPPECPGGTTAPPA